MKALLTLLLSALLAPAASANPAAISRTRSRRRAASRRPQWRRAGLLRAGLPERRRTARRGRVGRPAAAERPPAGRRRPGARGRLPLVRNEVRQLRTERKLSQQQLAEALEVSRQTINSIEKERYTPSLPLAIALARYFGKPVEEVFHADT